MFLLSNKNGVRVSVNEYGGRIVSLWVPDKFGKVDNVVLGYKNFEDYKTLNPTFGATVGRFANRIAKGKFSLDGKEYQLTINNGNNTLHGGPNGFQTQYWSIRMVEKNQKLEMTYLSRDGEEGYPGNLHVKVSYALSDTNEVIIDYEATTDQPTVLNLTHHSFFNLKGEGQGDVLDHSIVINADRFCPVNENLIPTGESKSVKETPFDFLKPHTIRERIDQHDIQLKYGSGYDHTWVLNKKSNELSLAATVLEPSSGRQMEVFTTEPGLQFYTGNFLDGSDIGPGGRYEFRSGLCLETQHFPDSPNQPSFPTTVLRPGEVYKQTTIYKFDWKAES